MSSLLEENKVGDVVNDEKYFYSMVPFRSNVVLDRSLTQVEAVSWIHGETWFMKYFTFVEDVWIVPTNGTSFVNVIELIDRSVFYMRNVVRKNVSLKLRRWKRKNTRALLLGIYPTSSFTLHLILQLIWTVLKLLDVRNWFRNQCLIFHKCNHGHCRKTRPFLVSYCLVTIIKITWTCRE